MLMEALVGQDQVLKLLLCEVGTISGGWVEQDFAGLDEREAERCRIAHSPQRIGLHSLLTLMGRIGNASGHATSLSASFFAWDG